MEPIVELRGEALQHFLTLMAQAIAQDAGLTPVHSLHFAIDDGGLKVKVNGYTWSPPMGYIATPRTDFTPVRDFIPGHE